MPTTIEAVMMLAPRDEPVSIKTLKKSEIDKIMKAVANGKEVANNYYRTTVEPKILEREEVYDASKDHYKKKFPRLSEMSDWVSRDIKTSIDWIIPSVMEAFTGADNPVSIQPRNIDNVEQAKKTEQLLKYQLDTKNDYTTFCNDLWNDSLKMNYGIAKVWWKHEEQRKPMQIMISPEDYSIMSHISDMAASGAIEIRDIKEMDGGYFNIEYDEVKVTANYPVIDRLPPSELRFSPESGNIQDCKFVAHRKIVKGDYLKRKEKEGFYENVDEAIKKSGNRTKYSLYDETHNKSLRADTPRLTDNDDASRDVELYECYVNVDYNNDGIYEKLIVHTVGDSKVPIKIQENDFGQVPFFVNCSERNPATIFNEDGGFVDLIEQQQDLKTAVIRQLIINIAKVNHPQMAFDEANVDVEALLDNEDLVPTRGMPANLLFPISTPPLSGATMSLVEYAQNEIESQTGSTRYNQGLDSNSLNSTATGITAILGMADKKQKNMARISAENFFKPIFRFIIKLNQKYAEEDQLIHIGDKDISISKEDLDVDYDLILNVGQGAGTKEVRIQYIMVLLNQIYPVLAQMGIVNEQSWYIAAKSLLQEMGLMNAEKSLVDPASDTYKQIQAQKQQAQVMAQQAEKQADITAKTAIINAKANAELVKSKVPKVSATISELPVDAQVQMLKNMGLSTTPQGMALKEMNHVRQG